MEADIKFFKDNRQDTCNLDLADLEQAIVDIYKYIDALPVKGNDENDESK